jgi:DNA repair protein RadA/Sms
LSSCVDFERLHFGSSFSEWRLSSHKNRLIGGGWAVMGEVGLAGEIRPIAQAERRISECARMGFTDLILPHGSLRGVKAPEGVRLHGVNTLSEALDLLGLRASY